MTYPTISALDADRRSRERTRVTEPLPFRPGNPVWRDGWLYAQEQIARRMKELTLGNLSETVRAMKPEAPR